MELDIKQVKPIIKSLLVSGKLTIKQLCQDFKKTVGCSLPFRKLGFGTAEEYLRSMPDIVSLSGTGYLTGRASYTVSDGASRPSSANVEVGPNTTFRKSVQINVCIQKVETGYLLPRNQTKPNTSGNTHLPPTPDVYDEEEEEEDDELEDPEIISHYGSRRNEYLQEDQIESKIPSKIQDNLRQLIEDFPEGLWCAKLPYEYQKKFNHKLNYSKYQYPSVIKLCTDLPTIFGYVQPSIGDYLVFDRRRPMPNIEHLRHVPDIPTGQRDATTSIFSEIPNLNWVTDRHLLPTNVVHRGEHIAKTSLCSETQVSALVRVTSGYVYDLSKFYIVLRTEHLTQMDRNLRAFFKHQGNTLVIPKQLQIEGVYCVVILNYYFDRGLIISALPELPGFIKVFLIDYGAVTTVPCDKIHYLHTMFKDVPALAVRARLAEIWPPVSHSPWSMQASDRFRELMGGRESQKYFVAEIVHIDTEERCVEIYLQDKTDLDNRFYINEILCEERLAIYINQDQEQRYNYPASAPLVEFIYLTPTFEELETGRAAYSAQVQFGFLNRVPVHNVVGTSTQCNRVPVSEACTMPQDFPKALEDAEAVEPSFEAANENDNSNWFPVEKPIPKKSDFSLFPEEYRDEIKRRCDQSMTSLSPNATAKAPLNKYLPSNNASKYLNMSSASALNSGSASDSNILNLNYNSMPALQTHLKYSKGSEPYSNHYSNSNPLESLTVPPNFSSERNDTSPGTSSDSSSSDTAQNEFLQTNPFFNYHEDSSDDADDNGSNPFLEGSEEPSQINFRAQEMLSSVFEERGVNSVGQNQVACASGNDGRYDTALRQDGQNTIRPPAGLYGLPFKNPALPVAAEALQPMELNPTHLQLHEIQQLQEFVRWNRSRMSQMAHSYPQLPNLNPPGQNSSVSSFNPQLPNIHPHFQDVTPQLPFYPPFLNFAPNTVGGYLPYLLHLKSALTHTNSVLDAAIGFARLNNSE